MLHRRHFVISAAAVAASPALAQLDASDVDIKFGTTGSIFGIWPKGEKALSMVMSTDMRNMLEDIKHYGLQGFEPYSGQVVKWLDDPKGLKKLSDEVGIPVECVGDLPRKPGAKPVGEYAWLGGEGNKQLIDDMEACARDFLQPLGIDHWKNNMGTRPDAGPSEDQLKRLADTANEIGRRTLKHGVRLSLHPHIWGPMEREHEFRTVMKLTDPKLVWIIMDTGHNVLGGMDTPKIVDEYFPRITEFHLKDTFPRYRFNKSTPTREQHKEKSVYASVGQGGGVDFPGVFSVMRKKRFKGWAVFDIDAPRPGDGTGSVDDNIAASVNYLRTALHVKLPKADGKTGLFKG